MAGRFAADVIATLEGLILERCRVWRGLQRAGAFACLRNRPPGSTKVQQRQSIEQ